MGSGRAKNELTHSAKKPRERRRREKNQRKRLITLGMPEAMVNKMTSKAVRESLSRPEKVRKQYSAVTRDKA